MNNPQKGATPGQKPASWRLFKGRSINHRIFQSTLTIAVLTLFVRVVGLLREMAIAAHFGTSNEVDAYLMAFLLPNFVVNVLAGSLNAAFIPIFMEVREKQGAVAAHQLLSTILIATTALLLAIMLLLTAAAPMLLAQLAPGFAAEKLALTLRLYYWLCPIIVLQGAISLWSAVLNATERFALAAFLPAVATLVALVFLLLGAETFGIYSLAVGFTVGFVLQLLVLAWQLKRLGYPVVLHWGGWGPEANQVLWQYLPMIAGAVLLSSTGLVEQFMAATLPPGSVATLGYASRLVGVANGICAMALGTAVLPHFSLMVARADWPAVRHTVRSYRWLIFGAGAFGAVLLAAGSGWIVTVLFKRGDFSAADSVAVAGLQRWYALQLPFYAAGILLVRLISALHANKFLMWGSLVSLLLNIGGNLVLLPRMGLPGVALSNSLMYVFSFSYLSVVVWHLLRMRERKAEAC